MVRIILQDGSIFDLTKETLDYIKEKYGDITSYSLDFSNFKENLLQLEKQRLNKILDTYGYNGLSDIQFYASQNDEEAKALLEWYKNYDDGIWNWIDNDLQAITALEELLDIDLKQTEEQIFKNSIKAAPLP